MKKIPRFCVLVGANGTGKSTLFYVFSFLKEAMSSNIKTALVKQGGSRGFKEVRTREAEGNIEIEMQFRKEAGSPLITYSLAIAESDGEPVVAQEILKYRRGSHGQPWQFLKFGYGEGFAVTNEIEKGVKVKDVKDLKREEQTLKSKDILAIKGLAQFKQFDAVLTLGELIENWHISDFHINEARSESEAGHAEHLSTVGDNLPLVTQYLYTHHQELFETILQKLSQRIPGLANVEAKVTEEGRILLRFQDGSFQTPFLARYVSDGTIKMLAYLILLYDPNPHSLLCVEEPENQLYHTPLAELVEEFRFYAEKGGQVFVSTHSPDFLNGVEIDEVYWLKKENGHTTIHRALEDKLIVSQMEQGGKMGDLWKEGFFGEIDP